MVEFKVGYKVKIPKIKTIEEGFYDTYEQFIKKLPKDCKYLTVINLLENNFIRFKIDNMSGYTPIFKDTDLELYVEHVTYKLW